MWGKTFLINYKMTVVVEDILESGHLLMLNGKVGVSELKPFLVVVVVVVVLKFIYL